LEWLNPRGDDACRHRVVKTFVDCTLHLRASSLRLLLETKWANGGNRIGRIRVVRTHVLPAEECVVRTGRVPRICKLSREGGVHWIALIAREASRRVREWDSVGIHEGVLEADTRRIRSAEARHICTVSITWAQRKSY
jgi:hypothetical protein